jgi:hypothetical protein
MEEEKLQEVVVEEPVARKGRAERVKKEPTAEIMFDCARMQAWLSTSYLRLKGVYAGVRFDACDLPIKDIRFVLSLALQSLKPGGEIYVHSDHAGYPELDGCTKGEVVGDYVTFVRS